VTQDSRTATPATPPARKRVPKTAVVSRTTRLSPSMVRVVFTGPDLVDLPDLTYTDHYVKILFAPPAASYAWPFDPEAIKASQPADQWPVTRTYTIRSFDRDANELTIDFVVHGDEGLAGPWAAHAQPGDQIGFMGPGGAYAPEVDVDGHLLVGDEAAIPAIAAALERIEDGVRVDVYLEVAGPEHQQPLPRTRDTRIHWVHRAASGLGYGEAVAAAVRASALPPGRLQAFVHGNADMVKDLRRYLFLERQVDRRQVSISGYWRTGHTEDRWQATKGEFNQQMEAEEARTA
jgi:NADPH-dependent ferric siderophore reductase